MINFWIFARSLTRGILRVVDSPKIALTEISPTRSHPHPQYSVTYITTLLVIPPPITRMCQSSDTLMTMVYERTSAFNAFRGSRRLGVGMSLSLAWETGNATIRVAAGRYFNA